MRSDLEFKFCKVLLTYYVNFPKIPLCKPENAIFQENARTLSYRTDCCTFRVSK